MPLNKATELFLERKKHLPQTAVDTRINFEWFGLVGFYGISTTVVYLMPNPLYICVLNI